MDTDNVSVAPEEIRKRFFELESPQSVAALLQINYTTLVYHLYAMPPEQKYRTFYISKRTGGQRKISSPMTALKIIQQNLNQILQAVYLPKPSAHGFLVQRSIVTNAQAHAGSSSNLILNLDLQDFFPSINFGRVRGMFMGLPYRLSESVATVLAQICCYDNQLPQGAPTSPIVSNMICAKLDSQLNDLAYDYRCKYSRYADDITFSTSSLLFPVDLARKNPDGSVELGQLLKSVIHDNGFRVNQHKVTLRTKHERQEITGLVINGGRPNVKRHFIRQIRAMLHAWKKYGLVLAEEEFLQKHDEKRRNPWDHVVRPKSWTGD